MVGFECRNILKHFLELTLNLFSAYASWYVIFHPIRCLRPIWDFDLTIIEYPHRFKGDSIGWDSGATATLATNCVFTSALQNKKTWTTQ